MRGMFGLVLVAGVALAGSAVYLAKGYIGQTQTQLEQERQLRAKVGPIVQVYVLKKTKNYGDELKAEDVQLVYWPKNSLPDGVFMDEKTLFPSGLKESRYILRQMDKFEPVVTTKVTDPGQAAGLTGQIARGMRAFAIKVDVASGVSGFVQPGDRVDVYWTGAVDGTGGELTRLIESSTRIIAVDQQSDASAGAMVARTVTVAATPEQVARLAQAQATGRLALSLVGSGDDTITETIEVNSSALLNIQKQEVVHVEAEKVCTIIQRNGNERVEVPIPCTN
ncbi:MAG: Flp pilus assembly protein CpaB [Pseudotabrizicola sp.]|uniref:Flp pilus assembly protein CpaB n=1 Tax=Pseudotabrizicola sp. TaxID=2939647 RepID=UPI00272649A5|nr:Flp pilus assembly protein CpaB [Pseudotabrizicola sp.]MDO8881564.1 Flp pilus assembly protein CpaB [Pseudotabrizicola sp.]MDP2081653.1 Flp pilus assembly protein CpaB [Pseudotabrizicola sp.]MDZ7574003.1 Flp pilus assembly protein CpaB [Pseudotabrizicola sp.]